MKRRKEVFKDICDIDNINRAGYKAGKDKRSHRDVKVYKKNKDKFNNELSNLLSSKTYIVTPDDYKIFDKKTTSGKVREIKKLDFYPFRVTQHAIMNVLQEDWIKSLTFDSYNCVKGRGINSKNRNHNFTLKLKRALLDKYSIYALQMDIKKFYPSVNNKIYRREYRKHVKDKDALWLLDMHNFSTKGLPIGSPDSQLASHLVIRSVDRFIKEELKAKYYFRYADDMLILSNSKQELHCWQWRVMNYLYYNVKLEVKKNRTIFPVKEGIDMCGYVFYPGYTLLRKRTKKSIVKKRHKEKSMASYKGILQHCDSKNFINKVINQNNKHMDITQLGIKIERPFDGDNIKIDKLVDDTISILDFDVRDSTKNKGKLWVRMQVLYDGEKRFVKGGYDYIATFLKELEAKFIPNKSELNAKDLEEKKKSFLPLTNVIIRNNRGYYFEGTLK